MPKQSYEQQQARLLKGAPQTRLERIAAHLADPDSDHHQLDDEELQYMLQLDKIDNFIRVYGERRKVISAIKKLNGEDRPISTYKAEQLINEAQSLFSGVRTVDKPYWRVLLLDNAMKVFNCALKEAEYGAAINAVKQAAKILRLDQPDDLDNREQTGPVTYVMVVKTGDHEQSMDLTKIGYLSEQHRNELVAAMNDQAVEVEWEEIAKATKAVEEEAHADQAPSP